MIILQILGAILVLGVLIFVHEMGHYGAGRLLGFKILEFSLGMGPKLIKTERNGIVYSLRALPVGGMCRFYGEDEGVSNDDSFNAKPAWKRFIVVAAGAFMNILLAFLVTVVILMTYGDYVPKVDSFTEENSAAAQAGMLPGDILLAIDGKDLQSYEEVVDRIRAANPSDVVFTVDRDGERLDITVKELYDAEVGYNRLGVMISYARWQYGFFESIGHSFSYIWSLLRMMLQFLGQLVTGGVQRGDVMGPVGTFDLIGQAVRLGFETVLRLAVLISVNLGLMNILPLPALDGGRLVFIAIEAIFGKPVSPKIEGTIHTIGLGLLFVLMIVLTFSDIRTMFGS